MYATQKRALTEARQYERAPASVGSAAIAFQQLAGQAGNQAMLAHLGQRSEPAATGESLPNAIMQRFERKSGVPLDDVRVHYNSDKPDKFDAEAYARGNEIFIGPGNEQDLEHEVGHVVQQKMGQVRPTGIEHGFAVNRSPALEHCADVGAIPQAVGAAANPVVQCCGNKRRRGTERVHEKSTSIEKTQIEKFKEALNKMELSAAEKELFTSENFKGASMSDHKVNGKKGKRVGSLYFGGTSLDEDGKFSSLERTEINKIVKEYLDAQSDLDKLGKNGPLYEREELIKIIGKCKNDLYDIFIKNDIQSGGRIRAMHDDAPKISQHGRILRMVDPRDEEKGRLLEIFCDEGTGGSKEFEMDTHSSRGAFVKSEEKEEGEIKDDVEEFVENMGTLAIFPEGIFQVLAKAAKTAQKEYEENKKRKICNPAYEPNKIFNNYLQSINFSLDITNQRPKNAETRHSGSSPQPKRRKTG